MARFTVPDHVPADTITARVEVDGDGDLVLFLSTKDCQQLALYIYADGTMDPVVMSGPVAELLGTQQLSMAKPS